MATTSLNLIPHVSSRASALLIMYAPRQNQDDITFPLIFEHEKNDPLVGRCLVIKPFLIASDETFDALYKDTMALFGLDSIVGLRVDWAPNSVAGENVWLDGKNTPVMLRLLRARGSVDKTRVGFFGGGDELARV